MMRMRKNYFQSRDRKGAVLDSSVDRLLARAALLLSKIRN